MFLRRTTLNKPIDNKLQVVMCSQPPHQIHRLALALLSGHELYEPDKRQIEINMQVHEMDRIDLLKDVYTVLHYYKASSLMLLHDIKNSTKT